MAIITLITGANAGIGFELAAQLLAKGNYHVLLGCRSAEKGQAALEHLKSRNLPGSVAFTQLDVTDDDSINAAAAQVEKEHGRLDVLINNAAVGLVGVEPLRRQMREAFDTNATGPAVMGYAFAELLKKSENQMKRIVNVSSIHYQASKAAQNMVSAQQASDFAPHGVKVLCWNPGFTVSSLGPFNTAENGARPTEEAVRPLVEIIEGKRDDEAHVFLSEDGKSYPW
ncbi:hypothetical protein LTR10_010976 [Elasticomyces elasticus]|nr:hypothetical protein LTR10_010976 [Elasticomyces elasticus]KAK4968580.1 hypothetical protein LTR42_009863 [Elasticomyces elasticus]